MPEDEGSKIIRVTRLKAVVQAQDEEIFQCDDPRTYRRVVKTHFRFRHSEYNLPWKTVRSILGTVGRGVKAIAFLGKHFISRHGPTVAP